MTSWYVLVDREPVEVEMDDWARQQQGIDERRVAATDVGEDTWVSTVFLGMDHSLGGGPPILFETMVFRSGDGQECWRYCTWDAAVAGHNLVVEKLRAGESLDDIDPPMGGAS